nr:DUF1648 domain-containing protein [uncultured Microbacterium sp.]
MTAEIRRARTAYLWVGVIIPAAIIALAAIVLVAWLPETPDPSAIHWGADGVDGYGPRWANLAVLLGVGGGLVALFASITLLSRRQTTAPSHARAAGPQWSASARLLGAVSLGTSAMIAFLSVMSVDAQRGLADAADAADITPWAVLGLVGMAALALVGWLLQPRVDAVQDSTTRPSPPLALADGERAAWMGSVTMARGAQIVLGLCAFVSVALAVLLIAQDLTAGWVVAAVALLVVAAIGTSATVRVRASAQGLRVRSIAGWPRLDIAAADIASARAIRVDPFAEFGGWGYRIGTDGRRGFVLRTGEALEITRTDGRVFVVTVDDAATAASVLASAARGENS